MTNTSRVSSHEYQSITAIVPTMTAVSMIQPINLTGAGEGLDVGRDPGDEHPAAAFVVGEARTVMRLKTRTRRFISTVSAISTSRIRATGSQQRRAARRERGHVDGPHIGAVIAVVGQHAVVEHELHEDRHDEAADCGGECHHDRDRKTSTELRRDLDAALHHGEGTDRRCFVVKERGGLVVQAGRGVRSRALPLFVGGDQCPVSSVATVPRGCR